MKAHALTPYICEDSDSAIIICAGGGYAKRAAIHEKPVAEWLNGLGISAFVLSYRLTYPGNYCDACNAIRFLRSVNVARVSLGIDNINPCKIGIMGFSAGGHTAAMAATLPSTYPEPGTGHLVKCFPDLLILNVPVITMLGPHAHASSVRHLLGHAPPLRISEECSAERHVTEHTPPTFIADTWNEKSLPVENTLLFVQALRQNNVPCELHIYERGPHNFQAAEGLERQILDSWWDRLADWLRLHEFAK
jgi:acetyl esterase/lipase